MKISSILLAAGHGTRMKSNLPKMLHPLVGKALVMHALDIVAGLGDEKPVVVVGHGEDGVRDVVKDAAVFAVQEKQLGTGHAVMAAETLVKGKSDLVVVTYADMPLLKAETLWRLVEMQKKNDGPITLLTVELDDPHGFGRIVRGADGSVQAIVEEAVASPEQLAIHELNASAYCFRSDWLWQALKRIEVSPKGEYYLTDVVEIAVKDGLKVQAVKTDDPTEAVGVNNRVHLAEAEAILRRRINEYWMLAGVSIIDPATTYIEVGVVIGRDTTVYPNSHVRGKTVIGEGCEIGPNAIIEDCQIGNRVTILASVMEKAQLDDDSEIGPFGHLRKGAHLGAGVHMGNFGEVKNSYLAPGVKMGHFSYIGDAQIGENVNIGAGTITCNYDGVRKNKTVIGADVFIGSDTMLVAPLNIGDGARTGAGAVVTKDIPAGETYIGVPAHPLPKKDQGE
jgi:bifunctional UDP-N-acetylglucosamine pyrophosphorylase / glucosamine-1-phosphate N-acetyltransferase